MKPKNIILIRHGQSQGNVNRILYSSVPDYAVELTDVGIQQAQRAGEVLKVGFTGNFAVYSSPYFRTIQTLNNIGKTKKFDRQRDWIREEPRIREQEWCGKLPSDGFSLEQEDARFGYGHFYYRFDGGESCADVYDRVSDFMDTLHRDFQKPDFPENVLLVTHGMTMRIFIMRWFHHTVQEFESWANPKNCEMYLLELNSNDKYNLMKGPTKSDKTRHNYVCNLEI